ncbi:LOW QUALITY PROTEIN: hypothetical protein Cgig2_027266 [Carnegiea gigantea]|uniref:Uncharacterized protein n=1 Tax=Carnegiea gigantea TaxID=171969 RepID=A0A9Q1GK29_9CARY|nr:LOW QUALITY PROTEIN: hypothetical protein Cgig2_027266 [Carnegiea gigantea]
MPWSRHGVPRSFASCGSELPLFLPLMLGSGRHLLGSGIPNLKTRQPSPRLICIKQTGIQVSTKHKFLRIRRLAAARKKSLAKNFSLGSQFNGSRLASSLLGPLHRLNCLSHEPRDGPRPIVLAYIEHKAVHRSSAVGSPKGFRTSSPSSRSGTSPQFDSRRKKRKSYFQYFNFDFFSMAVMKPALLLKQYHPRSPVSLGALCTV